MTKRAGFSFLALILLLVLLLGLTLRKLDRAEKDRALIRSELNLSQQSIVDKLSEYLIPVLKQEQKDLLAGITPSTRVETVIEKLKGIDPALIQQAVDKAMREVAREETSSTTSTTFSQGVSSTSTTSTTTISKAPPNTTSTTSTSTSTSTTTSTTRPCTLNLGLVKLCL